MRDLVTLRVGDPSAKALGYSQGVEKQTSDSDCGGQTLFLKRAGRQDKTLGTLSAVC